MQCKSQPESGWKNLFLATVTDPPTPPSKDIQACFPSPSSLLNPPHPPQCRLTLPPPSWSLSALSEHSCLGELETMEYKLVKKKKKATGSRRTSLNPCFFLSGVLGSIFTMPSGPQLPRWGSQGRRPSLRQPHGPHVLNTIHSWEGQYSILSRAARDQMSPCPDLPQA